MPGLGGSRSSASRGGRRESTRLPQAVPASTPGLYADAGVWYDALALLSDQIDADPGNQALRQTRADLLRQVGLNAAANSEVASK